MCRSFDVGETRHRARPFWSWNTEVTPEKVRSQIKMFSDMGMGGFVIHSRNGLRTEYMGERFMDMVRLSVEYAESLGLKVWLYDEDRWPSGNGGGKVTSDRRFRQRSLIISRNLPENLGNRDKNEDYLVAAYRLNFNSEGVLEDYGISEDECGDVYAYVHIEDDNPRYNWQSNVDVLNKDAIAKFIETTHEKYYRELGKYFGNTIEAIFTDEPQGTRAVYADYSDLSLFTQAQIMWTDDLPDSYEKEFGEDIIAHIPAILWESTNSPRVRYRYHEHCAKRFKEAYTEQIGAWCKTHGIAFTGHFIYEESFSAQTVCTKDVMRCYADEDIPGIDNLQGKFEFTTALQCRSVAKQYGKKRIMSELYGVNNWDTSFREYIEQGAWQTALGVTVRVPHLSWMSMLGEGKRDYPATFSYQSPWYLDTCLLEDFFSRLHTVLEEGLPRTEVGVIHPIESFWTVCGPADKTSRTCKARDEEFSKLFDWMSLDGIDFDLINEALLPSQLNIEEGAAFIGKMKYDTVIVPNCITLRSTTLEALLLMKENGVRIIFAGSTPSLVDGIADNSAAIFAQSCAQVEYTYEGITSQLAHHRAFELVGKYSGNYVFSDIDYNGSRWLFLAPAKKVEDKEDSEAYAHTLKIKGRVAPSVYDAMTGEVRTPEYSYSGDCTYIYLPLYGYSTLLLRLENKEQPCQSVVRPPENEFPIELASTLTYSRAEENVMLLDMAEYSFDKETYLPVTDIMRIDTECRKHWSQSSLTGKLSPQPWSVTDENPRRLYLRFRFDSDTEAKCRLAYERLENLWLNGEKVEIKREDWFVDEDISVLTLPTLRMGENVIDTEVDISNTYGAEPMYLIGDFDVDLKGIFPTVTKRSDKIAFGSITHQGMPFYGGSLTYRSDVELEENGTLRVSVNYYRCEFLKVLLDGVHKGDIILPPYAVEIKDVSRGKHTLELVAVGNRHNTFGSLHWGIEDSYYGPSHWHKYGDAYSREYRLRDFGIMKCPEITLLY